MDVTTDVVYSVAETTTVCGGSSFSSYSADVAIMVLGVLLMVVVVTIVETIITIAAVLSSGLSYYLAAFPEEMPHRFTDPADHSFHNSSFRLSLCQRLNLIRLQCYKICRKRIFGKSLVIILYTERITRVLHLCASILEYQCSDPFTSPPSAIERRTAWNAIIW